MRSHAWRSYLLTASASLLTVFFALFAAVFAVAEPFSLTMVSVPFLLRLCVLSALVSALVYSIPRASLRAGLVCVLCGLLAIYVWWRWDAVSYGTQVLFHQITLGFHEEIPSLFFYELPRELSKSYQRQAVNAFFTAALPLLALWLGPWLTLRWPVWPAVGTAAGLVALPLLILRQPGALTLGAFLLFLALVILSRKGYQESPAIGARRVLTALLPILLIMLLLGGLLPHGANPRPLWVDDLRLALQRIPTNGIAIGIGGVSDSIPGEQSFLSAGPLRFDGHTVLQINSSSAQTPLFLRGFSAGQYTAEGWVQLDTVNDPYPLDDHPFLFPYQTQPGSTAEVRITDMASHTDYYYLPYYPSFLPQDAIRTADAYLDRPSDVDEYHISFLPQGETDNAARVISGSTEREYGAWVYRHYLDVPYALLSTDAADLIHTFADRQQLRPDFGAAYDHSAAVQDVQALASTLRDYLSSFTEYDQKTPLTPDGEDFVSWFLTESHRGYCVHYASAAVLFFRACGVPARYAAGYVARPGRANAVTNVPDRNAHAWVEVYVDGFGWQPVDVTPGFSGGGELNDPNAADPEVSPTPTAAPSQSAPSATLTPTPTPTPSTAPDGSKTPTGSFRLAPAVIAVLLILLGLAVLAVLVWLQARLRLARLRKRCTVPEPNQAVLALYRYLTALERRAGVPIPQDALALAQKAYFSQHTLTDMELFTMQALTKTAASKAEALPRSRRLLLKYVWALL
ncbi:MAG: transglutaminase-like domain-containing protein [Oscillospiraceae bacterium]